MNYKRVAEVLSDLGARTRARVAIRVRPFIAFRLALAVLAYPSPVAAAPPEAHRLSPPVASVVEAQLAEVFRTQAQSGAYSFPGNTKSLAGYPLMSTMTWDAYRTTGNKAALSQAAYSIARYYDYLLSAADRDGDRLVETRAPRSGDEVRAVDPGFNALLATDIQRLARINLELRRAMAALYWYDTARAVSRAVVNRTFDPESGYFFPVDAGNGRMTRDLSAAAALPASFDGVVGANHAEIVAKRHVVPWASDLVASPPRATTPITIERLVAVSVLRDAGRDDVAASLRSLSLLGAANPDVTSIYAAERATLDEPLLDRRIALDLFFALVRASRRFPDADVMRLERSMARVEEVARGEAAARTVEQDEQALRDVYSAVSRFRDDLGSTSFWSQDDRRAFPGTDATPAARRLADDVLLTARRAESSLFEVRFGADGLRVTTALSAGAAADGEDVLLRWQVEQQGRAPVLKSLQAGVLGEALAPVGVGAADGGPLRFTTRYGVRGGLRGMRAVTFMIMLESASGARGRYYAERSVFVHAPIAITARFPQGRLIQGKQVPIEISLARNSRASAGARYFWFSPGGLNLAEGNQGVIPLSSSGTAHATLHVDVPTPCRPGVFPFTLKFFSSERDAGTISSSLFKPYQWAAIGPFPAKGGLGGKLPPESGIALLQSYAGAEGMLTWKPVPSAAWGSGGELTINRVIRGSGVSYLYTVVSCQYETDMQARLAANCPAALFINGRKLITVGATSDSASAMVHLNADKNHIVVKLVGGASPVVSFSLGNNDNLAADEFNNDLLVLAEGYRELVARAGGGDESQPQTHRLVTFRLEEPSANSVAVVGSFNGWSPDNHRLQKRDDRTWEITLSLAPGRYAYRFLVDQKRQILDPSTTLSEPDGFGGRNSVVIVNR